MDVREATPADRVAVANVLDGALLDTDPDLLRASIERGETLVAVAGDERDAGVGTASSGADATADRILGALVRDGDRIESVAVRRRRRGQGIGTALIERALADCDHLVADFDERVRPFYESLDFEIRPVDGEDGRYRATREF